VCFHARPLYGSPGGDQVETSDARWFTTGDIPALPIRPAMRLRIGHALTPGRPLPHRLTPAIPAPGRAARRAAPLPRTVRLDGRRTFEAGRKTARALLADPTVIPSG
jgi:hypothetical protein